METVSISEFRANSPPVNHQQATKEQLNQIAESAAIYDITSPVEDDWDAQK